ncbi:MAG: hypothetical protein M1835_000611 [Candelina submexicana]|nr:MAG: hypothetical protein M1835_000611 [Candelina submexicana]
MTKLILSTSNIMNGGPSIVRRPTAEKSNTELTTSLRTNFIASQQALSLQGNGTIASSTSRETSDHKRPPISTWTARDNNNLFIPSIDFSLSGLAEERSQYDITVKLFYLPNIPISQRCSQTEEAVELVLKELRVPSIDLLIVSFPDIAFDADDEEDEDELAEDSKSSQELEELDAMAMTWRKLEALHERGTIKQLGLSEFGSQRLARFLPRTKVKPSVDQINVRDCCVVPKPLILFAKQQGIELLTHNDCTNILPRGTVRELLGPGKGAGILAGIDDDSGGLTGEVEPQWVVKYTAVVKNRGVVENKGYFAVADLKD